MEPRILLDTLLTCEKLKGTMRHCVTSNDQKESVASHSWLMALMAYFMKDEFKDVDMNKVIVMCLIHDLGEAFTGDIPVFDKTKEDEEKEEVSLFQWVESLPFPYNEELRNLFEEMKEQKTLEAKIYKSIDKMEAVFQHNVSDISTWLDFEYDLNLSYGFDQVLFSDYLLKIRKEIYQDTVKKIEEVANV
ncbi:MAG: HD domain-containing protein [Floccifex sp.]